MLSSTQLLFAASILAIASNLSAIVVSRLGGSQLHKAARTSGIIGFISLALIAIVVFFAFTQVWGGSDGSSFAVSFGLMVLIGFSLAISLFLLVLASIASTVISLLAMRRS